MRLAAGLTQSELARRTGVAQPNIAAYEAGRRTPSDEMLARLRTGCLSRPSVALAAHRDEIRAILARHNLRDPRVFGSVARGTDGPGSDLDLVVTAGDATDVLDLIDSADEIEDLLGFHVDLVTDRALRPDHPIRTTLVPL